MALWAARHFSRELLVRTVKGGGKVDHVGGSAG